MRSPCTRSWALNDCWPARMRIKARAPGSWARRVWSWVSASAAVVAVRGAMGRAVGDDDDTHDARKRTTRTTMGRQEGAALLIVWTPEFGARARRSSGGLSLRPSAPARG